MSRVAHHMPAYGDLRGQFQKSYQLEMVADHERVSAILAMLDEVLDPDDVFCEVGCGTGIFAIEAAKRCRRVYAIELDPVMAEIAGENIRRLDLEDRVHVLLGDALEIDLPERVDVAFCELMSIWCVEEPIVPVANRVRRDLLKVGGVLLPLRIVNLVELAHYPYRHGEVTMPAVMPLFTGVARPRLMTESRSCRSIDFSGPTEVDLSIDLRLEALADGPINAAVLRSIVQMSPHVTYSGSDSLMPPTVVPLSREVSVRAGQSVRLRADLQARGSLENDRLFEVEVEE